MARHEWIPPSDADRIYQLELDMTMVHAAISKMASKLEEIEQAIIDRDISHRDAVEAQVMRLEDLLGRLTNEPDTAPATEQPPFPPADQLSEAPS